MQGQLRVSERSLRRDLIQLEKANIVGKLGRGPSLVWYLIAKGK